MAARNRNRNRNEALAKGSQALIRGEIDDPKLVELLKNLEDYVELEGAGGDYYYLSRPERKDGRALKDPDKVFLVAEPRMHGMEQHPMTHQAITACLLYTSPSPRDRQKSRMPSSA